uniref:hypothetical protein n=1 Tax=Microbacterium sp. BH-3-3-3 TaxID=1906742 RepID=UPI001C92F22C
EVVVGEGWVERASGVEGKCEELVESWGVVEVGGVEGVDGARGIRVDQERREVGVFVEVGVGEMVVDGVGKGVKVGVWEGGVKGGGDLVKRWRGFEAG